MSGFVIAIDGPVASGKGTLAPRLAQKLHGFYLYTGAMYRGLSYFCIQNNISFTDTQKIISILPTIKINLHDNKVFLNSQDVTDNLKDADVARGSATVATIGQVREFSVKLQQEIASEYMLKDMAIIAEGRDTGTKVFPDASLKIFLTATPEIRAHRRLAQLLDTGDTVSYEKVLQDVKERDLRDTTRDTDPLPSEPEKLGYIVIDNSDMTEESTLDVIITEVTKKNLL